MKWLTKTMNEWLITILLFFAITISIDLFFGGNKFPSAKIHYLFNTQPTTLLMGQEALDAIAMFRGDNPEGFNFNKDTLSVLSNVILYFLIGPFLFYLGYKNGKEDKLKPWYWYIGGAICIGSLAIVPTKLLDIKVFENVKESTLTSRTHDMMRQELFEVGFEIMEHEIFYGEVNKDFNLDDIELNDLQYKYEIVNFDGDTLLTLKSTGHAEVEYSPSLIINMNDYRDVLLRND